MDIQTDYLIVGSGLAGLFFALKAAQRHSVALVTKSTALESNTAYAQGGIAAVMDRGRDSFALHVRDTLEAGAGLCDRAVVELVVREGPEVVDELMQLGARFSRETSGELSLGREGGHSQARVVHAADSTGREISRALLEAVARGKLKIFERHLALELLVEGRCWGAQVLELTQGQVHRFTAPFTLLATGGLGQAYLHTTNPRVACGDGLAMAYRAGAAVGNLEFMQFHPTMFYQPGGPSFLISEALRGYGGVLVDRQGRPFAERYHPKGSLATRDIVARAIVSELRHSGGECVYLDLRGKDPAQTRRRFPGISEHCARRGVDITADLIPVMPAAHYLCGGVRTDAWGQTELPGLYAAGEVALTGLHGANRLASNSLLEALVFARRAWTHAREQSPPALPAALPSWQGPGRDAPLSADQVEARRQQLRRCMWEEVGILRTAAGLERACQTLDGLAEESEALYRRHALDAGLVELRNLATAAQLMARGARTRQESRGGHFNSDYPQRDDAHWQRDTLMRAAR
ncbi:MAG: L-aspartate oxidase [Candidatus Latescibacteria bacterium]|nr:L-aspartate oxidase [Candidatus Latescibacterota bacterium]